MENTALKEIYYNLLLKRDNLSKEALDNYKQYISIYGELLVERYEANMEIIKLRKRISFCIRKQNYGLEIKSNELEDYIEREMVSYENELNLMISEKNMINSGTPLEPYEVKQNKKRYYEIVKKLHPDLHPDASKEMIELFEKATTAYKNNDTKSLEWIYDTVMLLEDDDAQIDDLEEKISKITEEIKEIETTEPYILKYEFTPSSVIDEKLKDLRNEIEASKLVIQELTSEYEKFEIVSEVM